MKESNFSSFLAGVVIGGLVGAAVGLLIAPQAGSELREHVGEIIDEKRSAFDDAVNEGRQAAEQARADMLADQQAAAGEPEGAAS